MLSDTDGNVLESLSRRDVHLAHHPVIGLSLCFSG
jgi:hypothetical protein